MLMSARAQRIRACPDACRPERRTQQRATPCARRARSMRWLLAGATLVLLLVGSPALASKGGHDARHIWKGKGVGHGGSVTPPGRGLGGRTVATKRKIHAHVPELDRSGVGAAALLLLGGTLVVRERRRPARRF